MNAILSYSPFLHVEKKRNGDPTNETFPLALATKRLVMDMIKVVDMVEQISLVSTGDPRIGVGPKRHEVACVQLVTEV